MDSKIKIIAGPCSAESRAQVLETAKALKDMGVKIFRAGVWKPRTRPGGFEGAGDVALEWLADVRKEAGMKTCCEVATPEHLHKALDSGVDILWIGARTTADPFAVQAIADGIESREVTILIKNPVNPDVELWAGAVERFRNAGVKNILLVHRGFSSYDTGIYRNLPLWHIPIEMKRRFPDIPVLCDPSHMGGRRELVLPLSQQALDLMYDGLMIECHCNPDNALSDKLQQLSPAQLSDILSNLKPRQEGRQTDLESLRNRIDVLDESIMKLLKERMVVSEQIGDYKLKQNMPVFQSQRYSQIVDKVIRQAESLGLDPDFAASLMELIHKESVRLQLKQRKEN
ncbi:MAG: bifunctional 3-deoxy-7-phosphoheptulonate synthase/chorismate mutase type II [Bacteroidales bacterium]|nr:bifunctional 3-deoxy-7-phosphoheptulonate synthase/chorismate mutase type II [Bacteroidales bacterium]